MKSMIISLDPGFGNTKVCANGHTAVIQTAVARPHRIGLAATGLRSGQIRTVAIPARNESYVVGPNSWMYGETISSLDYSSLHSDQRLALFYAAVAEALVPGDYQVALLVIGLPVPLLQDEAQARPVIEALRGYKGSHHFVIGKSSYALEIERLKVLAQPVGSYADWLITSDLRLRHGAKDAQVAVADLGMNTLDLYVLTGGEVNPRFISGAKVGVRRLLHTLNGHGQDVAELDAALRAGRLRANTPDMASWLGDVMGVIEGAWPTLSRFSAVIPTGGGSLILGNLLRTELARRGAAVAWPDDPITANARGMWKWYARREGK